MYCYALPVVPLHLDEEIQSLMKCKVGNLVERDLHKIVDDRMNKPLLKVVEGEERERKVREGEFPENQRLLTL